MSTKQLLSSNSYLQYPKFLGYHIGVNASILLSALCDKDSWCETTVENYDGWFYFYREHIMLETGLSESQQRTALKTLEELEVVTTKNKGVPAKKYYFLAIDNIENLLEDAWNAYKTQMLKNCTSRDEENANPRVIENSNSTIDKNKDKKNKEKTPAEPVSPRVSKTRRNFGDNKLKDDLASGEEIKKQTADKKRKSKEEKCIDIINNTIYTDKTKALLLEYFNWNYHSDSPKKIKGTSDLKQKLDRLDKLVKQGYTAERIIQSAIDNQWYGFFEPTEKVEKKYDSPGVPDDGVISQTLHGDEVIEELKRREAKYGVF